MGPRALVVLFVLACSPASSPGPSSLATKERTSAATGDDAKHARELARAVLSREDLVAYRGWIKYLLLRAETNPAPAAASRLAEWAGRILGNPAALSELRGVHEWAYESRADGTGQPFKISIPARYDAREPLPLSLYLHGTGANHLEFSAVPQQLTAWSDDSTFIEVSVLGRGRGVGYVGLGEADVLDVVSYVVRNFAIDLDRIHLVGVSMGGVGVALLAARHPHRFASIWSVCGSAVDVPVGNLLQVPVYATHGDDDRAAPPSMVHGVVEHLSRLGNQAVWDSAPGYGHAVWKYAEGNARAREWTARQKRLRSREVRNIDFTALDADSSRAWWVEVAEWGPRASPARFVVNVEQGSIRLRLENVLRLRLDLADSPLDTSRAISLEVRTKGADSPASQLSIGPGSARSVVIRVDPESGAAALETTEPEAAFRLHTPGGPNQLYNGDPILIVYGTRGSAVFQQAQKEAAQMASRSSTWGWMAGGPTRGNADGVPLRLNLYGSLPIKADVDVTREDVLRNHLVLIGTADQNAVVERLAAALPVQFSRDGIDFSDGMTVPSAGRTLRLLHYNPEAPDRLLFWTASENLSAYREIWSLLGYLSQGPSGADALVTHDSEGTLVLARSFDSRWRWTKRQASPLLALAENSWAAIYRMQADAARRAARADFAVTSFPGVPAARRAHSPEWTRISDVTPYYSPLSTAMVSGRQLLAAAEAISAALRAGDEPFVPVITPTPSAQSVQPNESYSVVATPEGIFEVAHRIGVSPSPFAPTGLTMADALKAAPATTGGGKTSRP